MKATLLLIFVALLAGSCTVLPAPVAPQPTARPASLVVSELDSPDSVVLVLVNSTRLAYPKHFLLLDTTEFAVPITLASDSTFGCCNHCTFGQVPTQ